MHLGKSKITNFLKQGGTLLSDDSQIIESLNDPNSNDLPAFLDSKASLFFAVHGTSQGFLS